MAVTVPWKDLPKLRRLLSPEQYAELERACRGRRNTKGMALAQARPQPDPQRHEVGRVWTLVIEGWRPVLLNELLAAERIHFAKAGALKKADKAVVAAESLKHGVPVAAGKRRVGLTIADGWSRRPDKDNVWKSLLDSLTAAGLLLDDRDEWCETAKPVFPRGRRRTIITLEEI